LAEQKKKKQQLDDFDLNNLQDLDEKDIDDGSTDEDVQKNTSKGKTH